MTRRPITERQQQVYQLIRKSLRERGIPPTLRELGDALGIRSTNGVADHLQSLVRKGWIELDGSGGPNGGGVSRGIRLPADARVEIDDLCDVDRARVIELVTELRTRRSA
jgi:repressor LexA